jgi:PAS domain S-box-containing protein
MLPDFRVRQRDYLLEVSRAITEELDLDRVLARIVRVSAELLSGHAGLIVLRGQSGEWRIASSHGIDPQFLQYFDPLLDDIPDQADPGRFVIPQISRRLQRIAKVASLGLLTGVGLPLVAQNEVVGVIFVFRSYRGQFTRDDRSLLEAFASQAAIAVHNASLYTELSRQKRHLDTVLESSADGIFILSPGMKFIGFNPACSRLTGYQADEVLGRQHSEIIRWLRREPGSSFNEAEANGWPLTKQSPIYVEGDLVTKDGGALSVGITYAPALSTEGKLLSIVANVRDITKFREAEEVKSAFISIISHELRTPVALIKGYVGTLRREDASWDPEVTRESLAVIEDEADRLTGLIDDLLDASRLQAGALSLKWSQISMVDLVNDIVRRFQTQAPEYKIKVDFEPNFPLIVGDEGRLTQVVSNLLSNAIKYSNEGGTIVISGRAQEDKITVCVHDQGPGIAREDVPRVFDLFYRSKEASRRTKGAGLGLFLAKAVIEAHQGHIWVDEETSGGAKICFTLPLDQQR